MMDDKLIMPRRWWWSGSWFGRNEHFTPYTRSFMLRPISMPSPSWSRGYIHTLSGNDYASSWSATQEMM